jgi:hypothetical protein
LVNFRSQADSTFVLVGCAVDLELRPKRAKGGCIYTFLLTNNGVRFEFIHRTPTPSEVYAIHDFRGMALIGVGNLLRMYDFGKKKLLAKCENRVCFFSFHFLSLIKNMARKSIHKINWAIMVAAKVDEEGMHFSVCTFCVPIKHLN